MQQIRTWHGSPSKEMSAHPSILKIIGSCLMREYVNEELSLRLQSASDLSHEKLVVLHVLEKLHRQDAVIGIWLKFVVYNIPRNHPEIAESLQCSLVVNIYFLRP